MRTQTPTQPADRVIAGLAARQHGVVGRWQLTEAGLTGRQISLRLRSGRLHQIHRGVYLVGHAIPPRYAPEMAALLAFRLEAALSHRSAAALWNLVPYPAPGDVCVTMPPERSATRPRIEVYRANLEPRDVRRHHGVVLTCPPRTILDLAGKHGARARGRGDPRRLDELERLVAEAGYRGLASEVELRAQIERNPHKRGVVALRNVLDLPGGPRRTRSPAERALLRLLRESGIAGYETNARIHGYEVDLLWRDLSFAVEIDGYDAHSGRIAFERDHLKIATLTAHGLHVMPITGRQIRDDGRGVVRRLLQALEGPGGM